MVNDSKNNNFRTLVKSKKFKQIGHVRQNPNARCLKITENVKLDIVSI